MEERKDEIKLLSGNEVAALAAYLCGVKYVAGYPITPATQTIEELSRLFQEKGRKFETAESEYSVLAKIIGASLAGKRTFTATSSHGLALMHELLHAASNYALPIVMAVANRSIGLPWNIWSDQTDSLSQLYTGWIQFYCENVQEVFDTIILAYKIAEYQEKIIEEGAQEKNRTVLTPIMVCFDGFTISHTKELIVAPSQKQIKEYLPEELNLYHKISLEMPFTLGNSSCPYNFAQFQKDRIRRFNNALEITEKAVWEFEKVFGRKIAPIIDGGDNPENLAAKNICIAMGGISGALKEAVAQINKSLPDASLKVLRIKLFNPFPEKKIRYLLGQNKTDRIIILNNSLYPILTERIKASLYRATSQPEIFSRIVGVGGSHEVSSDFLEEKIKNILTEKDYGEEWWIDPKTAPRFPNLSAAKHCDNLDNAKLITPGHRACSGCGAILPLKWALEILGEETVVTIPACCWSVIDGPYPASNLKVMTIHSPFAAGVQIASGVKAAFELQGKKINSVVFGGDGSVYDIGFGALSAAAEKGEKIICICYDNEGYMNTGNQRSGATPFGAKTETSLPFKQERKKNIIDIMAAHKIVYAAFASVSEPKDFREKIEKAIKYQEEGLCFIDILCPCPTGWGFKNDLTIEVARKAVRLGIFPLYEIEKGKYKLDKETLRAPSIKELEDYFAAQKRFANLTDEDKIEIQKEINNNLERLKKMAYIL